MFRLIFALFAYLWSAVLDAGGSAGGGGGEDGSGGEGGSGSESFTLTADELTNRTNAAAEARATEIAGALGVDLSNPADVKAMIEAGRKAQEQSSGGQGDKRGDDKPGEGGGDITEQLKNLLGEALSPITERLGKVEGVEEQRRQQAANETRTEKLTAALKEANVRDDRLEAARAVALASESGVKLNDKGELEGSKEAIEATKKALPEAFRGDGDNGQAADGSGRKEGDRKPKNLAEALTAHYSKST